MAEFILTPWESRGEIDYNKLIREFGLGPMGDLPPAFRDNILFRRDKIFAQRDFGRIVDAIQQKKPFAMMTGMMPTGKFHIGHAILAKQFIFYQNMGARLYIAVADIEAYNAREQSLEESRKNAIDQYITNYIALGLKPKNCEIYFQSNRSAKGNKAVAYYRLQNILARYATFNEFRAVYGEISPGKMDSALLQAADMLHPQLPEFEGPIPVVVPVGIDQDPHIRLARDLASRIKTPTFIQLSSTYHLFVPGLSGGKMSSSDPTSFVALTDDEKTVRGKVNKYAFSGGRATIEEHRRLGGNPDVDVAYQWLTFFEENDQKLKEIYEDYKSGKMLSGELKQILIDNLNTFLKKHQAEREKAGKKVERFIETD